LQGIPGLAPLLRDLPPGCAFHPRCSLATERCRHDAPALRPAGKGAVVACHLAEASA
jgi:oligopeptide/dipeptide ABC transporter ATP-binding protein